MLNSNEEVIKANLAKLPKICAAKHPSTQEPVFIVAGEKGYFPTSSKIDVNLFNADLKITTAQVNAMIAGSLFGWAVNAADADHPSNQPEAKPKTKPIHLKYHSTDDDYCRVYYVDEHQGLWCWQMCRKVWHNASYHQIFDLMACTSSGEPIGPRDYTDITVDTMPPDDDSNTPHLFIHWYPRRMEYAYLWNRDHD